MSLNPNFPEGYNNLGLALKDKGNLDEAIVSFKKAVELNNSFPEAYNNLGNLLYDLGRYNEAEKLLRRALVLNPNPASLPMPIEPVGAVALPTAL